MDESFFVLFRGKASTICTRPLNTHPIVPRRTHMTKVTFLQSSKGIQLKKRGKDAADFFKLKDLLSNTKKLRRAGQVTDVGANAKRLKFQKRTVKRWIMIAKPASCRTSVGRVRSRL